MKTVDENALDIKDVMRVVKAGRSTIYAMRKKKVFPQGYLMGGSRRWAASHIQEWLQQQIKGATK